MIYKLSIRSHWEYHSREYLFEGETIPESLLAELADRGFSQLSFLEAPHYCRTINGPNWEARVTQAHIYK